jgi:hypothetical protein
VQFIRDILLAGSMKNTGSVHVNVTLSRVRANHCYSGRAISITYSECGFVALGSQQAKRMRRIMLSPAASPALHFLRIT